MDRIPIGKCEACGVTIYDGDKYTMDEDCVRVCKVCPPAKKKRKKPFAANAAAMKDLREMPKVKIQFIDPEPFIVHTRRLRALAGDGWLRIVFPMPPSVNRMYKVAVICGRGQMYMSAEGKRYKKVCETIALVAGLKPLTGEVHLVADIYRPRKAGDLDNGFKSLCDSISGVLYHDDKQIKGICAIRHDDPDYPRAEVRVRLASGQTLNFQEFLI